MLRLSVNRLLPLLALPALFGAGGGTAWGRESAFVLPAGINRVRVVGVETGDIKDTFNSSGDVQGLAHDLNRSVSVNDIRNSTDAATKAQLTQLIAALNTMQAGLGDQLASSSANLYSDFTLRQSVYLAAWEYGLTDRLSLGVRVPVVRRHARVSFSATPSPAAASVARAVGNGLSASMASGLEKIASLDTASFEQSLFTSKGYQPPRDYDRTELGDIEYGGKYNFYRSELFYSSLLVGMSAPTGAAPDMRNAFDHGNGKGAWCMAGQLIQEFYPVRGVTLEGSARLAMSPKDTRDRAVPKNANDSLPSLLPQDGQVQSVTRQRGAQLESELAAEYLFPGDRFYTWGAYQYSQKSRDSYRGQGNLYYEGLAKNSDWKLSAGELGVGFSTIPAYRKRSFFLPMEVTFLYNQPLSGRNVPLAPLGRMDFLFYF